MKANPKQHRKTPKGVLPVHKGDLRLSSWLPLLHPVSNLRRVIIFCKRPGRFHGWKTWGNFIFIWYPRQKWLNGRRIVVVEHGPALPNRLVNRLLTAQRFRRLCSRRPRWRAPQPAIAFDCLFPVPIKCQDYQHCNGTGPSNCDAQLSIKVNEKQMQHEVRGKTDGLPVSALSSLHQGHWSPCAQAFPWDNCY